MQCKKTLNLARWSTLSAMAFSCSLLWAGEIKSISSSLQSGEEVVKIEISEPLGSPITGFAIQSPARIALDFPGASNGIGQSLVDIQQGNLNSAI